MRVPRSNNKSLRVSLLAAVSKLSWVSPYSSVDASAGYVAAEVKVLLQLADAFDVAVAGRHERVHDGTT